MNETPQTSIVWLCLTWLDSVPMPGRSCTDRRLWGSHVAVDRMDREDKEWDPEEFADSDDRRLGAPVCLRDIQNHRATQGQLHWFNSLCPGLSTWLEALKAPSPTGSGQKTYTHITVNQTYPQEQLSLHMWQLCTDWLVWVRGRWWGEVSDKAHGNWQVLHSLLITHSSAAQTNIRFRGLTCRITTVKR